MIERAEVSCSPSFRREEWDGHYDYNERGNLEVTGGISCEGCAFAKTITIEAGGHEEEPRNNRVLRGIVLELAEKCIRFREKFASSPSTIAGLLIEPWHIFAESRNRQTRL